MLRPMRVALAQVNPTIGDLSGNRRLVEEAAAKAASERADLVVLPEMVLTGYPPMDLLERDGFVTRSVTPTTPPQVEYALTDLGRSLLTPVGELARWTVDNAPRIEEARRRYAACERARAPGLPGGSAARRMRASSS